MPGLSFSRFFTNKKIHPFDELEWKSRTALILDEKGREVFRQDEVEVPAGWSQLATDIVASKYFRRAGVPGTGKETSVRQLITRVARTIREAGEGLGEYFSTPQDAESFEMELTHLLVNQMGAFNSPVWFNCGLYHQYGIENNGGNFYWHAETNSVRLVENAYEHPQNAACFIQNVNDSLESMLNLEIAEVSIFKYGSGTGTNFSKVRAKGEPISAGGVSSGVISFLKAFDSWAGSIKSGGVTRRSAKMVLLDMDHPEIVDFIDWKLREENKVKVLIAAGYPADFNGEAYSTISGQNSNNSVRIPDVFMKSCLSGGKWQTTYRTTGEAADEYDTNWLMDKIARAAWECADPGVQFDDIIQAWNTCKNTGRINATNPCSEFVFLDDTACNLASLNLVKFLTEDGIFDVENFRQAIRIFITAMEIIVDFSSYPTDKIVQNSHDFRPLGLGFANLGVLLMLQGIPYDSDQGRAWAGAISAILSGHAYRISAEIAKSVGSFPGFEKNREPMEEVITMHTEAATYEIDDTVCPPYLLEAAREDWKLCLYEGEIFGFRNAQISAIAPTGTIALLMDCDTTGIEPDFALVKFKKLAGGGTLKIVNQSVRLALQRLGYSEKEVEEVVSYLEEKGTLAGSSLRKEHIKVFECANEISPMGHLKMMATVQPFISGAISKTVNLPNSATPEEIKNIYLEAWRLHLKCVAVYRDYCKSSQPLNTTTTQDREESGTTPIRRRLPDTRSSVTHKFSVAGHEGYITVGMYDDRTPGEVFIVMNKEGSVISGLMDTIATQTSLLLQYGVSLEDLVRKFSYVRFEPAGWTNNRTIPTATSIVDYIFRWLGRQFLGHDAVNELADNQGSLANGAAAIFIPSQADAPVCESCGSIMRRKAGSCYVCTNCGATSGCS